MAVKMKRAFVNRELKELLASEKMSRPSDRATDASYWKGARAYWIMDGDVNAGRIDVCPHMRFTDGEDWSRTEGWLYIQNFSLIKKLWKSGFRDIGPEVLKWLIKYAVEHGFTGISTNERQKSSRKLIQLYESYGFQWVKVMPGYFEEPDEPCIILERKL